VDPVHGQALEAARAAGFASPPARKVRGPVVDIHTHATEPGTNHELIEAARLYGVAQVVVIAPLHEGLALQRRYPDEVTLAVRPVLHEPTRQSALLDEAAALLERVRPYVRKFHSSQYINDLATGDLCIALGYSGDVIQARNRAAEAGSHVEIAFRVPREGAQMSIDMLAIPADAPHPENALAFIDYLLQPRVIAGITNAVSYPNPNLAATPFVARAIREDPGIYPPDAVQRLFYIDPPAPRGFERARTRAWTRVKSGC